MWSVEERKRKGDREEEKNGDKREIVSTTNGIYDAIRYIKKNLNVLHIYIYIYVCIESATNKHFLWTQTTRPYVNIDL